MTAGALHARCAAGVSRHPGAEPRGAGPPGFGDDKPDARARRPTPEAQRLRGSEAQRLTRVTATKVSTSERETPRMLRQVGRWSPASAVGETTGIWLVSAAACNSWPTVTS